MKIKNIPSTIKYNKFIKFYRYLVIYSIRMNIYTKLKFVIPTL